MTRVSTQNSLRPRRVGTNPTATEGGDDRDGRFSVRRVATSLFTPEMKIGQAPTVSSSLRMLIRAHWLNILFIFIPIMFVARFVQGNTSSEVFAFAFLALLPTAKIFGIAMEDLTLRVNRHTAIMQCQLEFLQASLTGSILINILLVLGSALERSFQRLDSALLLHSRACPCLCWEPLWL